MLSMYGPSSWLVANHRPRTTSHTPVLGRITRPLYTGWRPEYPCRGVQPGVPLTGAQGSSAQGSVDVGAPDNPWAPVLEPNPLSPLPHKITCGVGAC